MEKLALLGGTPVRSRLLPYAHQTIDSGDIAAVGEALSSSLITQGPTLERFERALAGRARVKHAVAFSSGTAALHGACWAAGLGPGDRAITTPLTFAATANAVVYQGARPVFADIDAATLDLDPDAVKRAGRGRVRAVLSVDFAGLPCDYDRLLPLAREKGWTVIADAAHSFGGAYGDRPARLAPVRGAPASRALVGRPGHGPPGPARREHRRDPPLPARLPAPVLSRAVRVRSRAVSGGGKCRKAPGDAPALPHDEPRRSGRRAARPRQGLRPLREIGHGARWPTARDEPVPRDEPAARVRHRLCPRPARPARAGRAPARDAARFPPRAPRAGPERNLPRRHARQLLPRRLRRGACGRRAGTSSGGPRRLLSHARGPQDATRGAAGGDARAGDRELGHLGSRHARLPLPEGARVQRAPGRPPLRTLRARAGGPPALHARPRLGPGLPSRRARRALHAALRHDRRPRGPDGGVPEARGVPVQRDRE